MRRLLFLLLISLTLIFPHITYADQGWIINSFDSDITIQPSGVLHVSEEIQVDFEDLKKHGIYRYIPYVYHDANKPNTYSNISNITITKNNDLVPFTTKVTDENVEIKIGDANRTISGKQIYVISYDMKGGLRTFTDHDELYWNSTGNNWETTIRHASATIHLPLSGLKETTCFEGPVGSRAICSITNRTKSSATFTATHELVPQEGLTIVAGWDSGIVPILTAEKPKSFSDLLFTPLHITLFLVLTLFSVGSIFWLWLTQGRDKWVKTPLILSLGEKITNKPFFAHDTTVIEFEPPNNLRPGQIGVLVDERADTIDVTATIIDLASRGFITITEIPKKWLFGKVDYLLTKNLKDTSALLVYEKNLFNRLFSGRKSTHISTLKNSFYDDLKSVKASLYKELVDKNLFVADPETVRLQYSIYGISLVVVGIIGAIFCVSKQVVLPTILSSSLVPGGILLTIMARFMPRRTAEGYDLYRRIKGYRHFISTSEKHRQQFFENKNMFNEILPYAIVFGLTEKFAQSMKEMGVNTVPSWYVGTTPFTPSTFSKSINTFSSSLSQAIASTPQGSGFSSGGSSGGGFGGGGGGSW